LIRKEENKLEKLFYIAIAVAMVCLLLPHKISSISIIGLILIWIVKDNFHQKITYLKQNKKVLILISLYFLYIIGLTYTSNIKRGLSILEKNLVIIILPIVFASSKKINMLKKYYIFLTFAFANLLLGIFLIIIALFRFYSTQDDVSFYYTELTGVINIHPIYYAMYLLFSLVIIVYGYINKLYKIKALFLIGILILGILLLILLSSKMILATLLLFLMLFMSKMIKRKRTKLFSIAISLVLLILFIMSFSVTKNRILNSVGSEWSLISKEHFEYNESFTGITLRIITWKLAITHLFIEENPIIGVGPGDSQDFVDKVYAKHGMDEAGYLGFNIHNQFFEILIKLGVLGFLFFMYWIYIFFSQAYNSNNTLYLFFLILFFMVSITESNLEIHRGIVYFSLFNSLFFFSEKLFES
jgi:O-antigen ligase